MATTTLTLPNFLSSFFLFDCNCLNAEAQILRQKLYQWQVVQLFDNVKGHQI